MSTKYVVSVRLNSDTKKVLDARRGTQSISSYVESLILKDGESQSDTDIKSDINDIKLGIEKLLSQSDTKKKMPWSRKS